MTTKSYKSTGRAVSSLQAHLVLTTQYRRKVLTKSMLERLKQHIHNLCSKWNVLVIELEGEDNHIHLLFSYYPQLDLCKFINNLKTVTSRLIRKEFEHELNKTYRGKPVLWNGSYFIASCGGVTVGVLRKYIEGHSCPGALIEIPSAIPTCLRTRCANVTANRRLCRTAPGSLAEAGKPWAIVENPTDGEGRVRPQIKWMPLNISSS